MGRRSTNFGREESTDDRGQLSRWKPGRGRVQPVGGSHGLRPRVLEELQLMMEMVDGPHTLALAESPPSARGQHRHPEKHYEDQQDHNRHSPTTYLRSARKP